MASPERRRKPKSAAEGSSLLPVGRKDARRTASVIAAKHLLRLYRLVLAPLLGGWLGGSLAGQCRFEPSCSRYASGCIEKHGLLLGALLSGLRLCKCHPLHRGGYDPPPDTFALRWRNHADPTVNHGP
jgi:uncharacterized protein